jgi:cytosine/creatinine deaminase
MARRDNLDMLAFNLKLAARNSRKNILVSAGKIADKERLLPVITELARFDISIYATPGTSRFLADRRIENQQIHKITDAIEPNIKSFLDQSKFDLIVNVLTGDNDYDESSDSKLIRTLAIQDGIPLITDIDVAIMTIDQMLEILRKPDTQAEPWNLREYFFSKVADLGGLACYHAHFDKAYLISLDNLQLGQVDMQKKWELYKYLKENYTHDDLVNRISRGIEIMIAQGVTHCRSHVDADSTVKLLPVTAALEVKEKYRGKIHFEIGVQPLQGVLDKASRDYFVRACELADVVGGLPSKDRPTPEKHIDIIMQIAKDLGKPVDVHIDQENNPFETETELLALKTIEHGLQGRVCGIHAISVAAKPPIEQDRILRVVKDANMKVIVCPSAALSMKALDITAPLHNSIAPVIKLLDAEIPVYLGVDNIADLFMPLVDGDVWFECRALMEACRFYDIDRVAAIACDKTGMRVPTQAR